MSEERVLEEPKRIPSFHIVAESIPRAYYRAIKTVWEHGFSIRTQYDRKNEADEYIDPPSRDARVLIEVTDPFSQPRFSPLSFCEIGAYIAEIMGAKDHRVLPMSVLRRMTRGEELKSQLWPYTYHQRLAAHPDINGEKVDQIELATELMAKTPFTRRAMMTTAVPDIDPYLKEDVPCLREVQLRCVDNSDGSLTLNTNATWRSRDLYKAWSDNVIGMTFLLQWIADKIFQKSGRIVNVGSYAEFSGSLHIYGQDFGAVGGDEERGLQSFFDTFGDEDTFVARSLTSEEAKEMLVLPQIRGLLEPEQQKNWGFPKETVAMLEQLIQDIESYALIV